MPLEIRKIIFASFELSKAVELWRQDHPGDLPSGRLISCQPSSTHGLHVVFQETGQQASEEIELPTAMTVELLIRFCRSLKVPIPRLGAKHCKRERDMIVLTIGVVTGWQMIPEELRSIASLLAPQGQKKLPGLTGLWHDGPKEFFLGTRIDRS